MGMDFRLASEVTAEFDGRAWRPAGMASAAALPIVAGAPTAAAQGLDAELIELGARFEPLVDQCYVAHRRWSAALARAHVEHRRKFGDPADRDFEHPPEIKRAFDESCDRWDVRETSEAIHTIFKEMTPLANAINAAAVSSVEGFRAKALVPSGRSRH
jgi:hypothetical protein